MNNSRLVFAILCLFAAGCSSQGKRTSDEVKLTPYTMAKHDKETKASDCPASSRSWARSNNRTILSLANACMKAGKWNELKSLGEHLALHTPTDPWGAYYLSVSAEGTGEIERALWLAGLAVRKDEGMPILHYHKARIEWKIGDPIAAAATMKLALKLNPEFTEANLFLAKLYHQDQEYKSALTHYRLILKSRGDHAEALVGAGECAYQLKERSAALGYFQKAVSLAPMNWNLRLKLAELYESEKNFSEALQQYRRAKELADRRRAPASQQLQDLPLKIKELEQQVTNAEQSKISVTSPMKEGGA